MSKLIEDGWKDLQLVDLESGMIISKVVQSYELVGRIKMLPVTGIVMLLILLLFT